MKETKKEKIARLWKISENGNFRDWDEAREELGLNTELNDEIPDGFFTLSKAQAEIWDNKEEDEWSKYI